MKKTPIVLIIMDGYGIAPPGPGNAISLANTPVLDNLMATCPHAPLSASGLDVGLPQGQMGNSEVGHTNIGAGRVVFQDLPRITKSIEDGDFFTNEALTEAMVNCRKGDGALHLMGLMSDGGVHSHNTHVWALLELARRHDLHKVYLHCFLDGRDVPPSSGRDYVAEAKEQCDRAGARIATVMGRYYAMDRDKRWDRLEKAYNALVHGEGARIADPVAAVEASYAAGVTDEFMLPAVCERDAAVKPYDSVIFFNFRPDRAREITRAFTDPQFTDVNRRNGYFPVNYVCMTEYDAHMPNVKVAYPPKPLKNIFGEYVSNMGLTQLRIAETEKYAHVTFFFNGGDETVFTGEDRVLIPSPKVPTYDTKPEMSAPEVCAEAVARIRGGKYDIIVLNYANCDMVGHTGVIPAAVKAVETVDECVGKTLAAVSEGGGIAIVTADHGNADKMLDDDGVTPHTAHTTNPVPFILVGARGNVAEGGKLCDICPTLLDLIGLEKPSEMTGQSLIIKE
ncbi:MAG: 2,3-bisphosphoglycerate-independent phosphoglycerate mutase [Oscillospiraceae bacterium]|jgi:2,3-bisphosphoglycerate-independent phosphoglycerate mutase|nr:2,3-bisphosphoglycerate-independent phosphoglycerate mutase [Oscillospiraceae bacterium]